MPAESEAQRKAAGAALGAKRGGSVKSLRGSSKGMYESMTEDELEDFASKSLQSSPSREGEPSHVPSLPKATESLSTLDKSASLNILVKTIDFYLKEGSQSSIAGFTSKNFDICPNAVNVFRKLEGSVNSKTKDSIVFAAKATDDFLGVEKKAVSSKSASLDDIENMVNLMQAAHFHSGEVSSLIGEDLSTDFSFSTGHLITVMGHYESEQ